MVKEAVTITVWFIALFIAGVYYLSVANNWDYKWNHAILSHVDVYTQTSCDKTSCSNTYYIEEIFFKFSNTTDTCTVRRAKPYYFKGSANNVAENAVLGTTRVLYQTTYSSGTCFDDSIRKYWNILGGVFLSVSFIPIIIIIFYFIDKIGEWLVNVTCDFCNSRIVNRYTTNIGEIQMASDVNLQKV